MTTLIVIWIASIIIPIVVLSGKWLAMSGWKIPFVRTLTSSTKPLDTAMRQAGHNLTARMVDARHSALLKFHNFVYDDFIPWAQRRYRMIASWVYRLHRRLWSTLEYSRYSSHKVSDYLKQLSLEKEKQNAAAASATTPEKEHVEPQPASEVPEKENTPL